MQKITPFLWFDDNAEEAAQFYASVFKNAEIGTVTRYSAVGPGPEGSASTVGFTLEGLEFGSVNGGPIFNFSPAISFAIACEDQAEVDYFWERLSEGGKTGQCGWLTDRFGLSWQVVPTVLRELLSASDPDTARRVTEVMLPMTKLDIAALQAAAEKS